MHIENKIDNLLTGPVIFVGYIFMITGVFLATENLIFGLSVLILVAFFTFSYSGVEIDIANMRIKQYTKIFGLFKTGGWKSLDAFLGLTLIPMRKVNTIASRANLTTSTVHRDYRIYLVNKAKKPAFAIKKCPTREQAQNSIDEFSIWLKLPVYSIKR
ncbi:MAG TPA: hypothetical protein VKA38_01855 [Draconibacterium sp.]|nr:hypothetical protein [Draconibacterium sp.]